MIRRPPRSTQSRSSAASDVYKRQPFSLDRVEYLLDVSAGLQLSLPLKDHKTGRTLVESIVAFCTLDEPSYSMVFPFRYLPFKIQSPRQRFDRVLRKAPPRRCRRDWHSKLYRHGCHMTSGVASTGDRPALVLPCLLYTSDAADDLLCV